MSLELFSFARSMTLRLATSINEDQWDKQPKGQTNTVRWNIGHIFVTLEMIISGVDPEYNAVIYPYDKFFARGTSPADWKEDPPSDKELIELLAAQEKRVTSYLEGRLDQEVTKDFNIGPMSLKTLGDVLNFLVFHEGMHQGIVLTQRKLI